jgi:hypothetical protein
MKTKLLLIFLTLNGVFLGANNAFAHTDKTNSDHANISTLSQTISSIVTLDEDAHSLVELAINRALIAKSVRDNSKSIQQQPIINDKIVNPNSNPIINGKVIRPSRTPIINGRVRTDRPIINGIIERNPGVQIEEEKPLVNGLIVKPH